MALYKALSANMKSSASWGGGFGPWVKNEWYEITGPLTFENSFHCSDDVLWAMFPIKTEYIAQVEVDGASIIQGYTQCWQKMKVTSIKAWPASKGALVLDWAENRAHDYWAGIFPTEAGQYDTKHYQGQFAQMLSIIQPVYKSLFVNGDTIQTFATHAHKRKPEYIWQLESVIYLAYVLSLALTNNLTIYGGGPFVRIAEHVRPGSWATVRGFVEGELATLEEV